MISQIFILSARGDVIISREYRGDVPRNSAEVFFRRLALAHDREFTAPIFNEQGVNFLFIKRKGLMFVATTGTNVSPSFILEFLNSAVNVIKDYCGVLSEEVIRSNTILIYELLDEILDFGYVQGTSSESLKAYIKNTPLEMDRPSLLKRIEGLKFKDSKTVGSNASQRSIANEKSNKNEIFCDVMEYVDVVLNSSCQIVNCEVIGSIRMKSFLQGTPILRLQLNEDLRSRNDPPAAYPGSLPAVGLLLDDCNFHEKVDMPVFERERCLVMNPPQGEFVLMNYRVSRLDLPLPFRVYSHFEELSEKRIDILLKLYADITEKSHGLNVSVTFTVPDYVLGVSFEKFDCDHVSDQSTDFKPSERTVYWRMKKISGMKDVQLKVKLILSSAAPVHYKRELGPMLVNFEIPMHNIVGLNVRSLKLMERSQNYNPDRWVRYVLQPNAYVVRFV